jgi:hypothetical protein
MFSDGFLFLKKLRYFDGFCFFRKLRFSDGFYFLGNPDFLMDSAY